VKKGELKQKKGGVLSKKTLLGLGIKKGEEK